MAYKWELQHDQRTIDKVLKLWDLGRCQLSQRDIAEAVGKSPGQVAGIINRERKKKNPLAPFHQTHLGSRAPRRVGTPQGEEVLKMFSETNLSLREIGRKVGLTLSSTSSIITNYRKLGNPLAAPRPPRPVKPRPPRVGPRPRPPTGSSVLLECRDTVRHALAEDVFNDLAWVDVFKSLEQKLAQVTKARSQYVR